jgi:hypothetical protein
MNTAFFCGSLEPGRDGVGDYSRRLAGAMIRQGHRCVAIALNDPHVSNTTFESQHIEGAAVSVLRLPSVAPWRQRIPEARDWLEAFNPDWLSLQFVPFGFHRKGLCFGLGRNLAAMNSKASWHLMFHELWLGLGEKPSVKHRVYGAWQRFIAMDLLRRLCPRVVHTQAEAFRVVLGRDKIKASILPLFGNIPYVDGDGWEGLLEPLVAKAAEKQLSRPQVYLAGVLGMVHPEWSAEQAVNALFPLVERSRKRLALVFFGKSNLAPDAWDKMKVALQNRAEVVLVGERSSADISRILQTLDLGLATTPRQMMQKSGSVAAMMEHGLQVLATRNDWRLRGPDSPSDKESPRLFSPEQFASLKILPARQLPSSGDSPVTQVADQLLEAMDAASGFPVNVKELSKVLES